MRGHLYLILWFTACMIAAGCSGKEEQRRKKRLKKEETVSVSQDVRSIADEYRRLDKLCNEIEAAIDPQLAASEPTLTEMKHYKREMKLLRISYLNLTTEVKVKLLENNSALKESLFELGLNAVIIDELGDRIEKISRKLQRLSDGKKFY